jgi:hypothetical protein
MYERIRCLDSYAENAIDQMHHRVCPRRWIIFEAHDTGFLERSEGRKAGGEQATAPIDSNGATASLAVADDLLERVADCTQGEALNRAGRDLGRTALTELRPEIWVELMAKWAIGAVWGSPAGRV